MKIKRIALNTLSVLIIHTSIYAQEKIYRPVSIGKEVDTSFAKTEVLDFQDEKKIFQKDPPRLTTEYFRKITELRDAWMNLNGTEYKNKFDSDRSFIMDAALPVSVYVHEFSKTNAVIYIVFAYGHSGWHHSYILLKKYTVCRNEFMDDVFNLKELEKQYSFTFKKTGYGSTTAEMEKKLGKDYEEDEGQTPSFRTIHYNKYNLDVVIQDGIVKYLIKR